MAKDDTNTIKLIRDLLRKCDLPRDAIPYTDSFTELKDEFSSQSDTNLSNHQFWKLISKAAKKGGLSTPGKKKRAPKTRKPTRDQELEILRLLPDGIGSRDDLPYTRRFDELYKHFSDLTGTRFSKHEFWRTIASVAKKSRKPQPLFTNAPLGNLPEDTVAFLERMNPWWKASPGPQTPNLRRWAYNEVLERFKSRIAPVIAMRGPRQVGKTTIQLQLIERLLQLDQIPSSQILRVQFDEAPALGSLNNPVESIVRWFEVNVLKKTINQAARDGQQVYFFFDEVQNLKKWSEQIKAIVDTSDVQILVTGSSALRIGKGRDSLAGRLSSLELGPLRLTEIAVLRGLPQLKPFSSISQIDEWVTKDFWLELNNYAKSHMDDLNRSFEAFATYGGYPVCHRANVANLTTLAAQIVEDVVERTVSHERADGASEEIVQEVFTLLCRYAGERVSPKEITRQINDRLGARATNSEVRSAVDFLENTLLIRMLKPIELARKKNNDFPTICLCDHFLRYALLREEIPLTSKKLSSSNQVIATQAGHIIEGIIGNFFASTQGIEAFCLPAKKHNPEIDIILSIGIKHIPIEIKYRKKRVSHHQLDAIRHFITKPQHEASFGLVVTQEESGEVEKNIVAVSAKAILLLL